MELADNYLLEANQAFLEKDLTKSEHFFNESLKLFKYLPEAYLGLAKVCLLKNQKEAAIEKLNYVIKFDNTFVDAQIELADIYYLSGDTNRAIEILDSILLYDIYNAVAEHKLADIYEKSENFSLSKMHYEKAYLLAPNKYEPDYERSKKFVIENSSPEDLQAFTEWRKIDLVISRLNLAFKTLEDVNIALQDKNSHVLIDVIKSIEKCSLLNPYGIEINQFLSELYIFFAKSYHMENAYFSQLALSNAIHKRIGVENVLELLSTTENDKELAAAYLRRSLQLGIKSDDRKLTTIKNLWPAAEPLNLQKIDSPEEINKKYKYYVSKNETNLAESLLKERIQLYPKEDLFFAILGLTYYNTKDYEKAFLFFKRSTEMYPNNWKNYITFINAVYFLGYKDEAISLSNFVLMNADNESVKSTIRKNMDGYK